jgi:hypothetical protein
MSNDSNRGPSRAIPGRPPMDPAQAREWFRRTFGDVPAPTSDMDPKSEVDPGARRRDASVAVERTVPAAYKWAKFGAPELAERVGRRAGWALEQAIWREPKLIFTGLASTGKTSLAVACLRRWVAEQARPAGFFHAYALGVARLQHPAGHGEPEIVERAMRAPLALLDDLGSEREMSGSAVPDVIFTRHADDRPLWVTTGLTREQLAVRYGAGIVRRLFERARVITVGGTTAK